MGSKDAMTISVDLFSLDELISTLTRLREQGGNMNVKDLWMDGCFGIDEYALRVPYVSKTHPPPNSEITANVLHDETLQSAMSSVRKVKRPRTLLTSLLNSFETPGGPGPYIEDMTKSILGSGITSLPVEILMRIFDDVDEHYHEYELENECDPGYPRFATVCQHFRAVAIQHARLWNRVSNRGNMDYRKLQIERSEDRGLHFRMYDCNGQYFRTARASRSSSQPQECICAAISEAMAKQCDQWEFLRAAGTCEGKLNDRYRELFTGLHLPKLRAMEMSYRSNLCDLCVTWDMPSLKHLYCDTEFLKVNLSKKCRLQRLQIRILGKANDSEGPKIVKFIQSEPVASHLVELTLQLIGDCSFGTSVGLPAQAMSRVSMNNLKTFALTFFRPEPRYTSLFSTLGYLGMPNVEKIFASFWEGTESADKVFPLWVDWMCTQAFPELQDVQVSFIVARTNYGLLNAHVVGGGEERLLNYWRRQGGREPQLQTRKQEVSW